MPHPFRLPELYGDRAGGGALPATRAAVVVTAAALTVVLLRSEATWTTIKPVGTLTHPGGAGAGGAPAGRGASTDSKPPSEVGTTDTSYVVPSPGLSQYDQTRI